MTDFFRKLGANLKTFEYRAGFQEDALMTVVRIKASKPRQGFLRAFDQPSFDKSKLPPLPEGLETFAVTSVEPSSLIDLLAALPPQNGQPNPAAHLIEELKSSSRLDLQKDVLAHLGPKMAFYTLPPVASRAAEGGAGKGAAKDASTPAGLPGLPGMNLAGMMGMGPQASIPRGVLIAEVKNETAFGKGLDNLMVALNKQLRDQAADAAEKAAKDAKPDDAEGGRGKGRRGGGAAAASDSRLGSSRSSASRRRKFISYRCLPRRLASFRRAFGPRFGSSAISSPSQPAPTPPGWRWRSSRVNGRFRRTSRRHSTSFPRISFSWV